MLMAPNGPNADPSALLKDHTCPPELPLEHHVGASQPTSASSEKGNTTIAHGRAMQHPLRSAGHRRFSWNAPGDSELLHDASAPAAGAIFPKQDPLDRSLPGSSVHGIPRQEYWSG